jgi:hypothetical protein
MSTSEVKLSWKAFLVALLVVSQPVAAQSSNSAIERVKAAQQQLETCFKEQIVKLGRNNQETAETLLRAVRSLCEEQDDALGWAYSDVSAIRTSDMVALRARDREDAENSAVAALLTARANDEQPK